MASEECDYLQAITCIEGFYVEEGLCNICSDRFQDSFTCTGAEIIACDDGYELYENTCSRCEYLFPGSADCDEVTAFSCRDGDYLLFDGQCFAVMPECLVEESFQLRDECVQCSDAFVGSN